MSKHKDGKFVWSVVVPFYFVEAIGRIKCLPSFRGSAEVFPVSNAKQYVDQELEFLIELLRTASCKYKDCI